MFLEIIVQVALLVVTTTGDTFISTGPVTSTETPSRKVNLKEILPQECGLTARPRIVKRISDGRKTSPYENPWMAALVYDTKKGRGVVNCGGSLITYQYVLTATHCISSLSEGEKLVSVRLGEWNITAEADCIKNECKPPHIDVPIADVIWHESYNSDDTPLYDIALLKLAQKVKFTDAVRPICLPRTPQVPDYATVVGWGIYQKERVVRSDILLGIDFKIISVERCNEIRARNDYRITLTPTQICTFDESGVPPCGGDSGGPLMGYTEEDYQGKPGPLRRVVLGVASSGSVYCNESGKPGVYNKVYDFLPLILGEIISNHLNQTDAKDEPPVTGAGE